MLGEGEGRPPGQPFWGLWKDVEGHYMPLTDIPTAPSPSSPRRQALIRPHGPGTGQETGSGRAEVQR